jgi:hypothetical protein
MGPFNYDGATATFACRKAANQPNLSPKFDVEPFFTPLWPTNCLGNCRCYHQRVTFLRDTASITPRSFIRMSLAHRLKMLGAATGDKLAGDYSVAVTEQFRWRDASRAATNPEYITCGRASVTRSQIAFWPQPAWKFRWRAIRKLEPVGPYIVHMAATALGFRCIGGGPNGCRHAEAFPRELLRQMKVIPLNYHPGFVAL